MSMQFLCWHWPGSCVTVLAPCTNVACVQHAHVVWYVQNNTWLWSTPSDSFSTNHFTQHTLVIRQSVL